jgi:hypothetical protein
VTKRRRAAADDLISWLRCIVVVNSRKESGRAQAVRLQVQRQRCSGPSVSVFSQLKNWSALVSFRGGV